MWGVKMVTGIFLPGKFPPEGSTPAVSPRKIPSQRSLVAKYALDANLFPLESSILTRSKRATNRNNVATEKRNYIFSSFSGGFCRRDSIREPQIISTKKHEWWNNGSRYTLPGKFPPERSTPVYSPRECSPPKKPNVFSVFSFVVSVCSSLRSR